MKNFVLRYKDGKPDAAEIEEVKVLGVVIIDNHANGHILLVQGPDDLQTQMASMTTWKVTPKVLYSL